ncbi:MAG TPA: hypothetical protein V6C89_11785 [Drouetiella sp.]|jgi:hypothetical protein
MHDEDCFDTFTILGISGIFVVVFENVVWAEFEEFQDALDCAVEGAAKRYASIRIAPSAVQTQAVIELTQRAIA